MNEHVPKILTKAKRIFILKIGCK